MVRYSRTGHVSWVEFWLDIPCSDDTNSWLESFLDTDVVVLSSFYALRV